MTRTPFPLLPTRETTTPMAGKSTHASLGENARTGPTRISTSPAANAASKLAGTTRPDLMGGRTKTRPALAGKALAKSDQLLVVTQLAIMLRSGVDLADAVKSLSGRAKSERVRQVMSRVYHSLEQGKSLSYALELERASFGSVMVSLVAAGEAAGCLPDVLGRLSSMIRDEMRLRASLRSALGYPVVLLSVTFVVLLGMVFFVLPQFASIFESSQAEVPFITRLMLDGGQIARGYWWLFLIIALGAGIGCVSYARSVAGRRNLDRLIMRLPLVKGIATSLIAGRLFRLQGAMLESGVPMLEVLDLTRSSVGNTAYVDLLDDVRESVVTGEGFANLLRENPLIPDAAADMIATGEANGQLGSVLQTVGEFYESEGEEKLRDSVKIAEPAIIIGLGVVVGGIVLSVMLPMLDITTAKGL